MPVDLVPHQAERLAVDTRPEPGWGETGCVAPPRNFGMHGLHLSKRSDGRLALLVVNHDECESVDLFNRGSERSRSSLGSPFATWVKMPVWLALLDATFR